MLGKAAAHRVEPRAAFIAQANYESLVLCECLGCREQPWQVRDQHGGVVRFYSLQKGAALYQKVQRSHTKVIPLANAG